MSNFDTLYVGGPTSTVQVADESGNLFQAGTQITATAAEINRVADKSASVVTAGAGTLTVTQALHANRIIVLGKTTGDVATLPAATGTGDRYTFNIGTAATSGANIIKVANATDVMEGFAFGADDDVEGATGFSWNCETNDDTVSLDGTATGGKLGDRVEVVDYKPANSM